MIDLVVPIDRYHRCLVHHVLPARRWIEGPDSQFVVRSSPSDPASVGADVGPATADGKGVDAGFGGAEEDVPSPPRSGGGDKPGPIGRPGQVVQHPQPIFRMVPGGPARKVEDRETLVGGHAAAEPGILAL